jgi:hypothetical protein
VSLFRRRLKTLWEFRAQGILFRIHPPVEGRMLGEDRDPEKKTLGFFCLDSSSGKTLWRDRVYDEGWWTGIDAIDRDLAVLHGFERPEMPGRKGMRVIGMENGDTLWANTAYTLVQVGRDSFLVGKQELTGGTLLRVDRRTGAVLPERADIPFEEPGEDVIHVGFPHRFEPAEYPAVADEVRKIVPGAIEPMEVYPEGSRLVLSLHEPFGTPAQTRYRHRILVMERERGEVLYNDIIARNAAGFVSDAFFVSAGRLYYVRERQTLVAVPLD